MVVSTPSLHTENILNCYNQFKMPPLESRPRELSMVHGLKLVILNSTQVSCFLKTEQTPKMSLQNSLQLRGIHHPYDFNNYCCWNNLLICDFQWCQPSFMPCYSQWKYSFYICIYTVCVCVCMYRLRSKYWEWVILILKSHKGSQASALRGNCDPQSTSLDTPCTVYIYIAVKLKLLTSVF